MNITFWTLFLTIFFKESTRSKVYVAMDFSGRQGGRILDNPRDVRGCDKASTASKDGYVPFR